MILPWIAYAIAVTVLFGLTAACADGASAGRMPRRWIWMVAILASVAVPTLLPLIRASSSSALESAAATTTTATATATAASDVDRTTIVVLGLWFVASSSFALLLGLAHARNRRMLRACRGTTISGQPILVSADFGPAVVGVMRPRIVVPEWTLALDAVEQRMIVAHEAEHACACDPLFGFVAVAFAVLVPWNPGVWWQLARLRLAIELDCDARVVGRRRHAALDYGQLLVRVGERDYETRHPVLALSHSRSSLARRIDALTSSAPAQLRRALSVTALGLSMIATVGWLPRPRVSVPSFSSFRAGAQRRTVWTATYVPTGPSRATTPAHNAIVEVAPRKPEPRARVGRVSTPDAREAQLASLTVPPVAAAVANPSTIDAPKASALPARGAVLRRGGVGGFAVSGGRISPTQTPGGAASGNVIRAVARPVGPPPDTVRPPQP